MKLSNLILKAIFTVAFFSTFLAFVISIIFQYNSFKNDRKYINDEYIELKKDDIKREVLRVHELIEYRQSLIKQNIENKLVNRVNQAYRIATSIYEENKKTKNAQEIKYLIVTALRNISYNEKRSYFFINRNDGKAILFNKISSLNENKNVWDLKDIKGNYVVRRQSQIALEKEKGFVTNYFIKPDLKDNIQYPKLSYIKLFKPFNWHIGTGEYLDDMIYKTKQEILKEIASIRFGQDGYIFVNTLDAKALVFDGKKLEEQKPYTNKKLFKQQLQAVKNKDGGFFNYQFKKLNTTEKFHKIAFAKKHDKWNWIIGSGVYLDEIDKEILRKEDILKNNILQQTSTFFIILIILALFIYYTSKRISKYIYINVDHLIKAFKEASKSYKEIDTKLLTYREFAILAKNLNKTLKSRNKTESKLQDYVKMVNDNIIISTTDKNGIITYASNAFCKISGCTKEELLGNSHNIVRHKDMPKDIYEQMWTKLKSGKSWYGELKNKKKNGKAYWIDIIIHPNYKNDTILGYTAISQDITDKKRVEYLSITDELTQLYNRRYFNIKIEEEISRAKREDYYISFIMLDIDYFKKYNDTYGHQAGDVALQDISKVLIKSTNRASDFAFRLGGEEFGIIFSQEDKNKSIEFANLIKNEIENLKIEHSSSSISPFITASIGLIVKKGSAVLNSNDLYKEADEALYAAKSSGRNQIFIN